MYAIFILIFSHEKQLFSILAYGPRREKTCLREFDVKQSNDVLKFLKIFQVSRTRDVCRSHQNNTYLSLGDRLYIPCSISRNRSLKHRMDEFILLAIVLIYMYVSENRAVKFSAATNAGGCLQPVIIEMMHIKFENVCKVPNNIIQ